MSAMSGPLRHRAMSMNSGRSAHSRGVVNHSQEFNSNMPTLDNLNIFEPCAATAAMFLYAQGNTVFCCDQDTLQIARRFSRHSEDIKLLAVDNQSDVGAGRLVVTYDTGHTAIVWDLMTGEEMTRFASYEPLTVATWMKNGCVAFGNTRGNVILFDPGNSEHESTRTLEQIAVTALAPSSDCRTFAIGFQNGSAMVATLQPRFTVLHFLPLSTSPLVTLAWHASSSRQKSDMLATQTYSGDLRVWSVPKANTGSDGAKVVRILSKQEHSVAGPNWMAWSKNGRIIQYTNSQTLSWDVRTKHVTSDSIPTLEHVRGLAVFGPGASLFTLGSNNTVQQFDLNSPAIMVANVQHANVLPPSPPVSIEEAAAKSVYSSTTIHTSESESFDMGISESDDDHMGPFARIAQNQSRGQHYMADSGNDMYDSTSQVSSRSGFSSVSRPTGGSKTPGQYPSSLRSRGMTENTYISAGTTLKSSTVGKHRDQRRDQRREQQEQERDLDTYSMGYSIGTTSVPSIATSQSRHRPSRLRNEVAQPQSPADTSKVNDLFPYTRARLSDIPYKHPVNNSSRLTNDDLRRQMLSTIFGWNGEAEDLVRDEMSRHPQSAPSRILLAKWLGDINSDVLAAASSENMTSSDWMLLALSGIGGHASQQKLGRAYVQRLLESGDIHAAVTIMLGMGDHNDAIEIYVSHKRYMEAVILVCMAFPGVWERQSAIVKKWGEWAASHRQQQLAVRCFACTDQESSEPWTSPSAAQLTFQNIGGPSLNEVLSPNYSPGVQRGPQRSIAKASALKLITSFGDQNQKSKFFSQGDDGATPVAGPGNSFNQNTAIPIDGPAYEATTAILKPSINSRFNTPTTARGEGPSFARDRLPSIGESPLDPNREPSNAMGQTLTLQLDQVNSRLSHKRSSSGSLNHMAVGSSLQRAATAGPMMMRDGHQRLVGLSRDRPPSPDAKVMMKMEAAQENTRNGPRERIPFGVNLQLRSLDQPDTVDVPPAEPSAASSAARYHWPSRRRGPGSTAGSVTSVSTSGRSMRHRNRDDYIHSLDTASQYSRKQRSRAASRERSRTRQDNWDRSRQARDASRDRGPPTSSTWGKQKHSPTSPVPMSPEDLISLSTPKLNDIEPLTVRKASDPRPRPSSRASSRASRRRSPEERHRPPALDLRGRSKNRDGSGQRSPSTAGLPLSANHFEGSEDEEDYRAAMEAREQFRAKHCKSASRGLNTPGLSKRERSESRHRSRAGSEAVDILAPLTFQTRAASTEHAGDLRRIKDERQRKKEQAARDLEERRKSLLKHPQAPPIPHPTQFSPAIRIGIEASDGPSDIITRSATVPPKSMYARGPSLGLPATPKAMRLVMDDHNQMPEVPPLPPAMMQQQSSQTSPEGSPKKVETGGGGDLLTLLPSTVYTPPVRPPIPRSMSAPIPDDPPSSRFRRKGSMGGLQEINEGVVSGKRRSHEDPVPPPPPPPPAPPVMLNELQHLASPPPPPPPPPSAPLPYGHRQPGGFGSGIEIVMDDDEASGNEHVPSYPAPMSMSGRHRASSINEGSVSGRTEGSISGRISKATERLRSASRSRNKDIRHMISPPFEAPYESISIPAGLHRGEMI